MSTATYTTTANATRIDFDTPPDSSVAVDTHASLNWYVAANAEAERRRRLFRTADEEEQMLLMPRPISTRDAYARFGMLLGTFPPLFIFLRLFGYGLVDKQTFAWEPSPWFIMFMLMNFVCYAVGYKMGGHVGSYMDEVERCPWNVMILFTVLLAVVWGVVTGVAGGLPAFGFGAIFGPFFAIPVAVAGFLMFTMLHRLLARGGMIESRHFWPLACGTVSVIAALILSPYVFPY